MSKLWLTVDPGEETGFCIWEGKEIVEPGQERMWPFIDKVDAAVHRRTDVVYLAGLLDGEGCIKVNANGDKNRALIQVGMTTPGPLRWAAHIFGGKVNGPYERKGRQPMFQWNHRGQQEVADLVAKVSPLLQVKMADAEEVLRFLAEEKGVYPNPFIGVGGIICEDWLLYPWVVKQGSLDFDKCRTARAIGALELIARQNNLPFVLQPASIKEGAEAAGSKELYVTPQHENRHANDAIDHGVFYTAKNGEGLC